MKRLGIISDIHGNHTALQAVLADMPADIDEVVCLGDVVGYGPRPSECIATVRESCSTVLQGNHDREVCRPAQPGFTDQAVAALTYTNEQLQQSEIEWLTGLSRRADYGEDVLLVHDHPEERDRYVLPREFPEVRPYLNDYRACFLGHTHVQHEAVVDDRLILNPGSVGQPRDGDPRAAYAVVNTMDWVTDHRRVEYDIAAVQRAVERAELPEAIGRRLTTGR